MRSGAKGAWTCASAARPPYKNPRADPGADPAPGSPGSGGDFIFFTWY